MQVSSARHAQAAAIAALAASTGDFLLLYVGNAQRSEVGLPEVGRSWLWIGGVIGVVTIPFYALGYRSASRLVAPASPRAAQALFAMGAAAAFLGAIIHALTAAYIGAQLDLGASAHEPLTSLASYPLLLTLWCIAALLVVTASALFLWFVARGMTEAPRVAALFNPAFVTLAIAVAGLPLVLLRAFLVPAAPNLAHLVFFTVLARARIGYPGG